MFIIAGLGNPGEEYADTRHNAGFLAVDLLAQDLRGCYWKTECGALATKVSIADQEVLLAKPQSFMNTSGGPVSQLMKKYEVDPDHLIVIHDELDLPPATIRVKFGGGLAGHNGLKSICNKLQTQDWYRIRIGIGRPPGRMPVADYVLRDPKGEEAEAFAIGIALAKDAAISLISDGLIRTQDTFN